MVAEIAMAEVAVAWGAQRPDRSDLATLKMEARQQKSWMNVKPAENGILRLSYALNPLTPCISPADRPALGDAAARAVAGPGSGLPRRRPGRRRRR
ncbi:MAG: hypothetical protein WDN49_27205 [Acetobacteraceae bacterium]